MKTAFLSLIFLLSSLILKAQDTTYLKIAYVEWEDIINTDSGWHTLNEAIDFVNNRSSLVSQVGFLLHQDNNYLILTESYFGKDNEGTVGTVIRIPICNVKSLQIIIIKKINKTG